MSKISSKVLTLLLVFKDKQVLLGMKKRGFGANKFNGFGGKVEKNETVFEGAKRELKEEAGITATSITHTAVLHFEFEHDPQLLQVHVFKTDTYEGEPSESDEMIPEWFNITDIPFDRMWIDDEIWFPMLIANKCFRGYFLFQGQEKLLEFALETITDSKDVGSEKEGGGLEFEWWKKAAKKAADTNNIKDRVIMEIHETDDAATASNAVKLHETDDAKTASNGYTTIPLRY